MFSVITNSYYWGVIAVPVYPNGQGFGGVQYAGSTLSVFTSDGSSCLPVPPRIQNSYLNDTVEFRFEFYIS